MFCSQATVSEECCKGLNTWNDAGCYCDGVASVLDDPNTPSAYVALARELNPACAVEKTTDTNHRTCAPPPPAPPPLPPPPRPPPEPPASSTLAFATTIAEETWGASFKSFVPDTWNAPSDEEYCGWMKDVLICDYFKTQDECDWADSDGGGHMEVLTPCEWYDGKCELRDPMQLGARELRNAFRNVLAASRSTHDACAASSACDGKFICISVWAIRLTSCFVYRRSLRGDAARMRRVRRHRARRSGSARRHTHLPGAAHGVHAVHARHRRVQRGR